MYHYKTVFDKDYRSFYAYSERRGGRVVGFVPCGYVVVDGRMRENSIDTIKIMAVIDRYYKQNGKLPIELLRECFSAPVINRRNFMRFYTSIQNAL